MLTSEVKQRINTCRDILLGKLPDPKSQVIQITNALIYKFMDDQDRLSEKMGGKASFFTGALKPYAWHKLFDSKLTNQERADLYVNGIERLSGAQNLPELFREIFKEAYVPFKAPATITLFIEEINKFSYHHSEELGNAYEYLLSIMGSQGDAGQFRTPRHVIEFMVDVIDPQKTETVYDPACGTAGFLIAAYTHITEANDGKLSASDKKKLAENISGIDISPDMAKMARVNLYLHGFTSPVINEGDTLSDEDLWGKKYDVILANPPFMSPKGGIIPHDKFGIKASRAEVLFVDYIAEHLKLKGRAAIVVPEGVIFQSGTTYKALRKMLVEDGYLHSVISLPAGVFQPYSGVKTSILVLDRERAKEATEVLFLKIDNDGFAINTQRTERPGSQLVEALAISRAWQEGKKQEAPFASWVDKEEIAASGDFNLTAERYRVFDDQISSWPFVELGDERYFKIESGGTPKTDNKEYWGGNIQWATLVDLPAKSFVSRLSNTERTITEKGLKNSSATVLPKQSVVVSTRATIGRVAVTEGEVATNQGFKNILIKDFNLASPLYVAAMIKKLVPEMVASASGGTFKEVSKTTFSKLKIPLPPIEVQQEIVAELDRYQKIIDGAHQIVNNWKPIFTINPEWSKVKLGEHVDINNGYVLTDFDEDKQLACIKVSDMNLPENKYEITTSSHWLKGSNRRPVPVGSIVFPKRGAAIATNKKRITRISCLIDNNCMAITSKETSLLLPEFLFNFMLGFDLSSISNSAGIALINNGDISGVVIPLPPLDIQAKIVAEIECEQTHVSSAQKLIKVFEKKIQDKIAEVWSE